MDEQKIMIDNVDVSECEFFEECEIKIDDSECLAHSRHFYEGTFYDCCDEHPDCYYKQLKRKEKECEELKEILKEGCLHNLTLMTERRVLLQTLTEIKDYCNKYPQNSIGFKKYILQKINEVLNGTNP